MLPGVWVFTAGYLAVWAACSLAVALLQPVLERQMLLSPMMVAASATLGGGLLGAAGIDQWLPLKEICLRHGRSPLQFITSHWRRGPFGAFCMGLGHGANCVGCCWVLMLLLFVGGAMNLLWVTPIAGFVFLEKVLPAGPIVGRVAGIGLLVVGLWDLLGGGA